MIFDLNRVQIIGRLTSNPESRTTASGKQVVILNIATNRKFRDSGLELTEFHKATVWGRLGEICTAYLKKGNKLWIEGRLHNTSWESKTGGKNYRSEIVTERMIMLNPKTPETQETDDSDQQASLQSDEIEIESSEIIT